MEASNSKILSWRKIKLETLYLFCKHFFKMLPLCFMSFFEIKVSHKDERIVANIFKKRQNNFMKMCFDIYWCCHCVNITLDHGTSRFENYSQSRLSFGERTHRILAKIWSNYVCFWIRALKHHYKGFKLFALDLSEMLLLQWFSIWNSPWLCKIH